MQCTLVFLQPKIKKSATQIYLTDWHEHDEDSFFVISEEQISCESVYVKKNKKKFKKLKKLKKG